MIKHLLLIILLSALLGCSSQDDDYIPYKLKGMNAWVSDENGNSYFAGLVEGGYSKREELKDECADLAYELAYSKNIENFGYVCCTVTSDSDCETKVR